MNATASSPRSESADAGARNSSRRRSDNDPSRTSESVRERGRTFYDGARERAAGGLSTSREGIAAHPLLSVAGSLTAGIALGMLLPRSRRERELLSDVGHKVTEAAREAADSAVEAGRQQVDEIKNNAIAKVGEAVVGAVTSPQD